MNGVANRVTSHIKPCHTRLSVSACAESSSDISVVNCRFIRSSNCTHNFNSLCDSVSIHHSITHFPSFVIFICLIVLFSVCLSSPVSVGVLALLGPFVRISLFPSFLLASPLSLFVSLLAVSPFDMLVDARVFSSA